MKKKPKLLLVDDHELMCQGLQSMLASEYDVVGVLHDGDGVSATVDRLLPDVLLLDLSLPKRSGMLILAEVATTHATLPVVIVTQHLDPVLADLAFQYGARGYVPKDAGLGELRTAIEPALAGQRYLSPHVPKRGHQVPARFPIGFSQLTPREQDIVRMIGRNKTSEEIGSALGVSHWTVHFHRKNILRKLGLQGERDMIRYAVLVESAWEDVVEPSAHPGEPPAHAKDLAP